MTARAPRALALARERARRASAGGVLAPRSPALAGDGAAALFGTGAIDVLGRSGSCDQRRPPRRRRVRKVAAWVALAVAVAAAVAARLQAPWIPVPYLAALIVLPIAGWRLARWRRGPRSIRWPALALTGVVGVGLLPVPWMEAALVEPPGTAWRLDGRLVIEGKVADPPGAWYWLTVGRPPVVAEVVHGWVTGAEDRPTSMLDGRMVQRPGFNEPAAVSVGLRQAGWDIDLGVLVEVRDPMQSGLPDQAVLTELDGVTLRTRADLERALAGLAGRPGFVTSDGDAHRFAGSHLPYRSIDVLDIPIDGLDAAIGGPLARLAPVDWFRGLALGRSHGLMLALVAYAHASGEDLAVGRTIAGTGGIRGDGTVTTIGGLRSKATAARRAGAHVLLFPSAQAADLDGFDPGRMRLVPVDTLDDAIAALR